MVSIFEPPSAMDAIQWTKGINSSSGGKRALRIVMPLGMAIDVIERANMDSFVRKAGAVECRVDELRWPDEPVWFLKQVPEQTRVKSICPMYVQCKVVELSLNFHQVMLRYQFRTPPKRGRSNEAWRDCCHAYVKQWIELLIAEKRRQMHASQELWPDCPWQVISVFTMPMVLWLSKPTQAHGKRQAPEPADRQQAPAYYYGNRSYASC